MMAVASADDCAGSDFILPMGTASKKGGGTRDFLAAPIPQVVFLDHSSLGSRISPFVLLWEQPTSPAHGLHRCSDDSAIFLGPVDDKETEGKRCS